MNVKMLVGDALSRLRELPDESVHCCVTSPPYWGLRDYGVDGQLGLERTPEEYVEAMVGVFREVQRVLRGDGTLWVNVGDCYNAYNGGAGPGSQLSKNQTEQRPQLPTGYGLRCAGLKPKDLVGIPWRLAFALQAGGWWLRSDIIWAKPNPMPESVTDRPTKSHEYVFLLSKSARYFYDQEAVREPHKPESLARYEYGLHIEADPNAIAGSLHDRMQAGLGNADRMGDFISKAGRNLRTVWTINTEAFPEAHFATFPQKLIQPCIKAGCPAGGTVLDPFSGAGTTGLVAALLGRNAVLIELSPKYVEMAKNRIEREAALFAKVTTG